ncbi:hypothetical protein EW146_g4127 [Bondarzewia mesenterica]|uniref:DUF323 domain-containing protein n=1 Tax=Bondarzewia mesenterica TaxID=1095465 RepID=A0A4S4M1A7_9AGAM|nr:hypothetical protein EW146_g4127 [Bondarzewia mesenterica]
MSAPKAEIIDVRVNDKARNGEVDMRSEIISGLSRPAGHRSLPTLLLYDERGLRIYDKITTEADEYYLFAAEENILRGHADDIVHVMHEGKLGKEEVVLELGAGALRKTSHILSALARSMPHAMNTAPITYYALDLEERELKRTLDQLSRSSVGPELRGKIDTKGMWGTYEGGLKFVEDGGLQSKDIVGHVAVAPTLVTAERARMTTLTASCERDHSPSSDSVSSSTGTHTELNTVGTAASTPDPALSRPPLQILFLGSSIGNFDRGADAAFLKALPLRAGSGDTLLLGLDHGNDKEKIEQAYDDEKGITRKFIFNGLRAAGRALGDEGLFNEEKWEYVGRYDVQERRHEAYYRSKSAQAIQVPNAQQHIPFLEDELLRIEVSHKFSEADAHTLFTDGDLRPIQRWTDYSTGYSIWLLERPPFFFPLLKQPASSLTSTPFGVPTFKDFQDMWAAWDFVTRKLIPDSMLFQKPIDLRHICLFYFGHIPTFLDIHLSRLLGEPHTEPEEFKYIFERGIDPIVDDPTQCHPHSEVPTKDEDWPSLSSILDFQSRVRDRLQNLYTDLESGKRTLTRKIARVLFMTLEHEGFHVETLLYMLLQRAGTGTIPPPDFTPPCWSSLQASWESQPSPSMPTVTLGPATVSLGHDDNETEDEEIGKVTDVKNHDFGWDNEHPRRTVGVGEFKIEWRPVTNGQFYEFWKGDGKDKVQMPKSWVEENGEIMVRTMYGPVPMKVAQLWPVLTSYDNLSIYASVKGGRLPTEPELRLFLDKFEQGYEGGKNVGFRNWHPTPATTGGGVDGRGHNGGMWEWTSTVLEKYEGFVQSKLYPGYSMDFFDNHHQVVIGGSYATIPRLSERRSLRNYYQKNYPYAWVGGRVAYDV